MLFSSMAFITSWQHILFPGLLPALYHWNITSKGIFCVLFTVELSKQCLECSKHSVNIWWKQVVKEWINEAKLKRLAEDRLWKIC